MLVGLHIQRIASKGRFVTPPADVTIPKGTPIDVESTENPANPREPMPICLTGVWQNGDDVNVVSEIPLDDESEGFEL